MTETEMVESPRSSWPRSPMPVRRPDVPRPTSFSQGKGPEELVSTVKEKYGAYLAPAN